MQRTLALAVPLLLAALAVPASQAFTSVPPGESVHDEVTAIVEAAGFPPDAVRALQEAVREVDMQEAEWDPELDDPGRIDASAEYRHEHHCDRLPETPDAEAFAATTAYIQQQRAEAANASAAGDEDKAIAALGRALHALQDCFSHSNIVDLPEEARRAAETAVVKGGDAPEGLRLTSFDPGADEPEAPEGDDYTHKEFAKDSGDKNGESKAPSAMDPNQTKFESARELARMATIAFVQEFVHGLPEGERALFVNAQPEGDDGLPGPDNIPSPGILALLACLAWAVVLWRK